MNYRTDNPGVSTIADQKRDYLTLALPKSATYQAVIAGAPAGLRVTEQDVFEAARATRPELALAAGTAMVRRDILRARDFFSYLVSPASPGGARLTAREFTLAKQLVRDHRRDVEFHLSRAIPSDPALDYFRDMAAPTRVEWAAVECMRAARGVRDLFTLNWF